jgi:hypothetical protein
VLLAFMPAEKLFLIDAATFAVSATAFAWLGRRAALHEACERSPSAAFATIDGIQARSSGRFCHSAMPSITLSVIVLMVVLETSAP